MKKIFLIVAFAGACLGNDEYDLQSCIRYNAQECENEKRCEKKSGINKACVESCNKEATAICKQIF